MSNHASTASNTPSRVLKYTSRITSCCRGSIPGSWQCQACWRANDGQVFEQISVGQWFRTVTGLVEVTAAIALLIPVTAGLGGLLLAITMCFAIFTHLSVIGGSPIPAIVLLLITASIAWLHRASILNLIRPMQA
ncbi:hypothetical protein D3C72_1027610 [compost metagenome]